MHDAAQEALSFIEDTDKQGLKNNRLLALSLVKCIEIIGEAASNISKAYQQEHSEIPWQIIIATRNRLIHGYFDIDYERVWDTVKENLPPLIKTLEPLLPSKDE